MSDNEEPKPAPQPEVQSPNNVLDSIFCDSGPMPPAKMGIRFLAFFMDLSIVLGTSFLILKFNLSEAFPDGWQILADHFEQSKDPEYAFSVFSDPSLLEPKLLKIISYSISMVTVTSWAYFSFSELSTSGYTLGKRACRLRTVSTVTLGNPNIFTALVRGMTKTAGLLFFSFLGWLAILLPIFFNKRRQMGHDLLNRTVVVDEKRIPQ